MAFNLIIPEINNNPKNTKDAVISILAIEWPLSAKKIFYRIKKQYRYSHTYQSVHKALKELAEKSVLKEKNGEYEINISWIKNLQSFTDIVETNYYAQKRLNDISGLNESKHGEDMIMLGFKSLFDAEKYLYYFMKSELFKKRNQTVCYQVRHDWRPLFYLRAEYNYFKRLKKKGHRFYFLSYGRSYLEEISRNFYRMVGINVLKSKESSMSNVLVFSDYFIQIFIPKDVENKIGAMLRKKDILGLLRVLDESSPVKIIMHKDRSLADEMKKQIIKKF